MKKKIVIEGMSCNHCVNHVTNALEEIKGIKDIVVMLDTKTAIVDAEESVKDEEIKFAIDDAGYDVVSIEEVL
ncbi:heavy-metal-associated domain-containing protein [Clostridium cellulovorans]|uniref:Heavy metal transport/detoxification protein n=1 Tax=Clostridium cellulovorans (strain ATCC 35296 / DSM 3052 / OCM 3 / 743B) TaxID=573061 RepID=D9SVS4_CLOC7|nr:cation transporter [Clostridium cellulovorans]ADL53135.1 Heavy metal transport/detoxification protein [Clostridium cellulovorans 743B]